MKNMFLNSREFEPSSDQPRSSQTLKSRGNTAGNAFGLHCK